MLDGLTNSSCVPALLELVRKSRLRAVLSFLHSENETALPSDHLVLPTLGSQEDTFENVKMSFPGEQGQKTRQLLNAIMFRRDSVKIYELLSEALSLSHNFLVPSGKIRDVTFVHTASGEMYMTSAMTNMMELTQLDIKDSNGSLTGGGGVSLYYSHTLCAPVVA